MEKELIRKFRSVLRRFDRELYYQNNSSCCNGISLSQCHALMEIEQKKDISVTEVSDALMLNKSTISRTVDGLVNIGLLNREIPKEDRRTAVLNLTDTGKKVCNDINWNNDRYIQKYLEVLNTDEQDTLITLLDKVTRQMSKLRNSDDESESCC